MYLLLNVFQFIIYFINYTFQLLEKRQRNNKQKEKSSSKRQKNSSKDKENIVEIEFDENPQLEVQRKMNELAQEMLTIQKQKNDELEREIQLIERRKQMLGL